MPLFFFSLVFIELGISFFCTIIIHSEYFPCLLPCGVHFVFSATKLDLKHIHIVYVPALSFDDSLGEIRGNSAEHEFTRQLLE